MLTSVNTTSLRSRCPLGALWFFRDCGKRRVFWLHQHREGNVFSVRWPGQVGGWMFEGAESGCLTCFHPATVDFRAGLFPIGLLLCQIYNPAAIGRPARSTVTGEAFRQWTMIWSIGVERPQTGVLPVGHDVWKVTNVNDRSAVWRNLWFAGKFELKNVLQLQSVHDLCSRCTGIQQQQGQPAMADDRKQIVHCDILLEWNGLQPESTHCRGTITIRLALVDSAPAGHVVYRCLQSDATALRTQSRRERQTGTTGNANEPPLPSGRGARSLFLTVFTGSYADFFFRRRSAARFLAAARSSSTCFFWPGVSTDSTSASRRVSSSRICFCRSAILSLYSLWTA